MITYTITNQKGGVGKTTTAAAIGSGLALRGYKVLFVDLDPQADLTYTLGVCNSGHYCAMTALTGEDDVRSCIQEVELGEDGNERAYLLAAHKTLIGADLHLTDVGKENRLREVLSAVSPYYDYCIVDTPPTLGILTVNAFAAARKLIIPAKADPYSLRAVGQLIDTYAAVKRYCNPGLTVGGYLLTGYNPRIILGRDIMEKIAQTASIMHSKVYNTHIRECNALREAQAERMDIFTYAPKSNGANDYNQLIDELLEDEHEHKELQAH